LTCSMLLLMYAPAICPSLPLPCVAIARAGDLPIVSLAARGHCHCNDLPIVALPAQAVNLPDIPIAARAGGLPVVTLVVHGHHKLGSLPVIALASRGHRKHGNLPILMHAAPTTCPTLPSPRTSLIFPSLHLPRTLAMLSYHQLPAALFLSSPAAEFFFG
jgi:hypothetical protein